MWDTENTGDLSDSTTVTLYADGEAVANESVSVDGGNSTTVDLTTSFSEAGTHNVTVNDLKATDITVGKTVPTLPGQSSPPTGTDNDDKYEDMNGDGEFNIVDVGAFFDNYDQGEVEQYPEFFDFNGDGNVNIVDVGLLFDSL